MKKILTAILTLGFSLSPIHAADYDTTHTFAAGDIISADMMNENFAELENVTKVVTEAPKVLLLFTILPHIFLASQVLSYELLFLKPR